MDRTVDALKALYVALGGSADDVATVAIIPDMINAIATLAGSAVELPAVGKSDNGDVLTVVNGKWTKAAIPSQLPEVTVADAGSVLKVSTEGEWSVGADNVE